MPPRPMTWGEIYQANLARGYDHGYAAWRADQAEERAKRKREKALKRLADLGQEYDRAAALTDLAEADAPIVEKE